MSEILDVRECFNTIASVTGAVNSIALNFAGNRSMIYGNFDNFYAVRNSVPVVNFHDHALRYRDSGAIILTPSSNQELVDMTFIALKVCEDKKVLLPCIINIEDENLRESVAIPTSPSISNFLPKFKLNRLDSKKPIIVGGNVRSELSIQQSMNTALGLLAKHTESWKTKFRRNVDMVEYVGNGDEEYVIVAYGRNAGVVRKYIDALDEDDDKIGLVIVRCIRPLPIDDLRNALQNAKKVAVIDSVVSPGHSGVLHTEIKAHYHGFA